jgi:ATP-dependent DNA ligase
MIDIRNKFDVECPRAKGMHLEDAPSYIWDEPGWVLEKKIDGERDSLQIGAKYSILRGRNREDFLKGVSKAGAFRNHDHLNPKLTAIACKELDGTLFDGELTEVYTQDGTLSEGTLKRKSTGEFLGYITWGVLFWKGKDVRCLSEDARYKLADEAVKILKKKFGEKISIKMDERIPATRENLKKFFSNGCEGAIAKNLMMCIDPNKKTNPWWWKLKADKKRTMDAFVIGVTEGKKGGSGVRGIKPVPSGRAATFTVAMMKDGKPFQVGKMSNLPDVAKQQGIAYYDDYDGLVAEMTTSGWNGKELRFPRFVRWRDDKGANDCQFEEQISLK